MEGTGRALPLPGPQAVAGATSLRYLVWISNPRRELCGCVQFVTRRRGSQPQARDGFIGWDDATRQKNLPRVVNRQSRS